MAICSLEQHAENIAQHLEENETLMDDSPESEMLRKQTLKNMPQCLTVKRHIKRRLLKSVNLKSKRKPLGFFKRKKYQISIQLSKVSHVITNLIVCLFYNSILVASFVEKFHIYF